MTKKKFTLSHNNFIRLENIYWTLINQLVKSLTTTVSDDDDTPTAANGILFTQ